MGRAEPGRHAPRAGRARGRGTPVSGLITQNVDGLHRRAGHRDLVELHGRVDRVVCLDCGDRTSRSRLQRRLDAAEPGLDATRTSRSRPTATRSLEATADFRVAGCERCGGRLKPDVVFFGENVPQARRSSTATGSPTRPRRSSCSVRRCRSCPACGSCVAPAPTACRWSSSTAGATRGDDLADVRVDAGCAETLTAGSQRRVRGRVRSCHDRKPAPARATQLPR